MFKWNAPHYAVKQKHLNAQEIALGKCLPDNVAGIQGPHGGLTQQAAKHTTVLTHSPTVG